jgi:peptidyl-prolyl cis-trans isomerase B (cyclophilin B)
MSIQPARFLVCVLLWTLPSLAQSAEPVLPFKIPVNPAELPQHALIETTKGPFEIAFFAKEAPTTVRNFVYLAQKGFYDGLPFHRYIENFVVQGGDPLGNGKGGPGYTIPAEFSTIKHSRGTLGMARKPGEVNPERRASGSQFYICLTENRAKHLDGLYNVFAQVVRGMEAVSRLRKGDKILSVKFE